MLFKNYQIISLTNYHKIVLYTFDLSHILQYNLIY
jgi:hypothetical protein